MSALIAILAILIVTGAFLWLKPSPRDQHLAKLRSDALIQGLRISSVRVPETSEYGRVNERYIIVTVYQMSLVVTKTSKVDFTVLRTTGESGAYLPNGWAWDGRQGLTDAVYESLATILSSMPESVSVISVDYDSVGISWDEKDPDITFDVIKNWCHEIAQATHRTLLIELAGS